VLLRGASKDVLNEMERNLQDAMCVGRNILADPRLVPGGGAFEMEVATRLMEKSKTVEGMLQLPYQAVARALEVIPRTLSHNCGAEVLRVITELRGKHADTSDKIHLNFGINGQTGTVDNMKTLNVWDTLSVKKQTLKTAVESACMILRIDDIVSGMKKKGQSKEGVQPEPQGGDQETFGDARDG
jgi:T-complex protein 1 subunit gamma